jgi:hypothetical protein
MDRCRSDARHMVGLGADRQVPSVPLGLFMKLAAAEALLALPLPGLAVLDGGNSGADFDHAVIGAGRWLAAHRDAGPDPPFQNAREEGAGGKKSLAAFEDGSVAYRRGDWLR